MSNGVKIIALDVENVKKVKAVQLTPSETGLTLIGGNNGQGKTSVLEAIMGALGGDTYKQQVREGAEKGMVNITLSNGVQVTRTYTAQGGSSLRVTDAAGRKGGQQLLNDFISSFALNTSTFLDATDKKKAEILLKVIGVNPQPFEERIRTLEADRLVKGRERDRAKGHAESLVFFPDAGDDKWDGAAISAEMTKALSHNAKIKQAGNDIQAAKDRLDLAAIRLKEAEQALLKAQEACAQMQAAYDDAVEKAGTSGELMDTTAINAKLAEITKHNEQVSSNLARAQAFDVHLALAEEYKALSGEIEQEREALRALLEGAALPYPGLAVENGVLTYNGRAWSTLSESERLILATAISQAVLPECKFVVIDGMERMDLNTLKIFTGWLISNGLQAIGTRVGDGGENTIIIEDGEVVATGSNTATTEIDFS